MQDFGWYAVPQSFKVYLKVDINVAAKRVFKDETRRDTEKKFSTIEKEKTGNIINLFTADIENISNGIIQNFSKILMGITTICFSVYIMINLNIIITFILIFVSLLMFLIS